jgi:hypothetical protein
MFRSWNWKPVHAMLAAVLLVAQGCSTQTSRLGPDDGTDACRRYLVALDSTGDYFAQDIVAGAAVGAIGGGLIGGLATGNWRGALIGAAAGGAAGALGGYYRARAQQAQDQSVLYRTMTGDIQRDNEYIDRTQLAFNNLTDCRQNQANAIRADLRRGVISRAQAQAAMDVVKQRAQYDLRVAQTISAKIDGRSADFAFANAQVNPDTAAAPANGRGPARPLAARPNTNPAAQQVAAATSTNLAKQDRFRASVQAAASPSRFELGA